MDNKRVAPNDSESTQDKRFRSGSPSSSATDPLARSIPNLHPNTPRSARKPRNPHLAVPRTSSTSKRATPKSLPVLNKVPTQRLDVYVFGSGEHGELGLGAADDSQGVKEPRLNHLLSSDSVGVVQIATGSTHVVALTYDHKIITWGDNEKGALGRDTKDSDQADVANRNGSSKISGQFSGSGDENRLNPLEATPTAIPQSAFPAGTRFAQVAAGECNSFALTDTGLVYGWGTFRDNEGILGFTAAIRVQRTPMLLTELKKIEKLACGANFVLALDRNGGVFAWGTGQQNQLGRRIVERTRTSGLTPREFGLPKKKIMDICTGASHGFALDKKGNVWTWGLNNYGECGIPQRLGPDDAIVPIPTIVTNLAKRRIKGMSAGAHHSIAIDEKGDCLIWGRVDGTQSGITAADLDLLGPDQVQRDTKNLVRILSNPTKVPNLPTCSFAAAGPDQTLVITRDRQLFSWGFSGSYQTGLGVYEDIERATLVDSPIINGKKLNWVGIGANYSILTAYAEYRL